jgi:hypothetical protein
MGSATSRSAGHGLRASERFPARRRNKSGTRSARVAVLLQCACLSFRASSLHVEGGEGEAKARKASPCPTLAGVR